MTNNGNAKEVIKMPESSVKSCPGVTIEGLEGIEDIELQGNGSILHGIRISASSSQSERMCEVTISIKSAGNGQIVSTIFQVEVVSNSASDDDLMIVMTSRVTTQEITINRDKYFEFFRDI